MGGGLLKKSMKFSVLNSSGSANLTRSTATSAGRQLTTHEYTHRRSHSEDNENDLDRALLENHAASLISHRWRTFQQKANILIRMGSLLKRVSIRRMADLPLEMAREAGKINLTVESEAALKQLRLWEQGDEELYTREALEARFSNRTDKQVWKYLNVWWETSLHHAGLRVDQEMPKQTYVDLYTRLCKALLEEDEDFDEPEAIRLTEEAWLEETRGHGGGMTRTMFNDSLFELTDMWTMTTDAQEYADFLARLHKCAAKFKSTMHTLKDTSEIDASAFLSDVEPTYDVSRNRALERKSPCKRSKKALPSAEERIRRQVGQKQRRAAVTIQKKVKQRSGRRHYEDQKQAAVLIQAGARRRAVASHMPRLETSHSSSPMRAPTLPPRPHSAPPVHLQRYEVPNLSQPPRYLIPRSPIADSYLERKCQVKPMSPRKVLALALSPPRPQRPAPVLASRRSASARQPSAEQQPRYLHPRASLAGTYLERKRCLQIVSPRAVRAPSRPCEPVSCTFEPSSRPTLKASRQPPSPPWDVRQVKAAGPGTMWTHLKADVFASDRLPAPKDHRAHRSAPPSPRASNAWLERVLSLGMAMPEAEAARHRLSRWRANNRDRLNDDEAEYFYAMEALSASGALRAIYDVGVRGGRGV